MQIQTSRGPEPLLIITEGSARTCFVSVNYMGRQYCVPASGANQTKQTFAILDQLQNTNTDTTKIPQPSVINLSGRIR